MAPDYQDNLIKPHILGQKNPCMEQFFKLFQRTDGTPPSLPPPWTLGSEALLYSELAHGPLLPSATEAAPPNQH